MTSTEPTQRFIVVMITYVEGGRRDRYVGNFRSIRSAESWAGVHAYDGTGRPYSWHVEPLEHP